MRAKRKPDEDFFIDKFMAYLHAEIDESATQIPEVTDKPDLAIRSQGKVIGVELSQIPSSYIIENFHKKRPPPIYTKDEIQGHLSIYPFEPHRWVHEVLEKKNRKIEPNMHRIGASAMWLVMHSHSSKNDWPMSKTSEKGSRQAEALLMRFGVRNLGSKFERIFYIYSDGTVVPLTGGSEVVPSKISLPEGAGYPAVTHHQFSFSFDVPLSGMDERIYRFEKITFTEMSIEPMDEWMSGRNPEIERPDFSVRALVTSEKVNFEVFRNCILVAENTVDTTGMIGKTMYLHMLFEWSIQKTTFTYSA